MSEALRDDFASDEAEAFPVVALGGVEDAAVDTFAADLSTLPGVTRVDAATGRCADGPSWSAPTRPRSSSGATARRG